MNIFHLDKDITKSAEYHCNAHVVKMVTELGQLLSTAYRVLDGKDLVLKENDSVIMKATHINHPCAIWVRQSAENYQYCRDLFYMLSIEYQYRYRRIHGSFERLQKAIHLIPENIDYDAPMTPFPLAMPDECKIPDDPIESYRNYYRTHKKHIAKWDFPEKFGKTRGSRPVPEWFK